MSSVRSVDAEHTHTATHKHRCCCSHTRTHTSTHPDLLFQRLNLSAQCRQLLLALGHVALRARERGLESAELLLQRLLAGLHARACMCMYRMYVCVYVCVCMPACVCERKACLSWRPALSAAPSRWPTRNQPTVQMYECQNVGVGVRVRMTVRVRGSVRASEAVESVRLLLQRLLTLWPVPVQERRTCAPRVSMGNFLACTCWHPHPTFAGKHTHAHTCSACSRLSYASAADLFADACASISFFNLCVCAHVCVHVCVCVCLRDCACMRGRCMHYMHEYRYIMNGWLQKRE